MEVELTSNAKNNVKPVLKEQEIWDEDWDESGIGIRWKHEKPPEL